MGSKPQLPAWHQIDGAAGKALTQVRTTLSGILNQDHLWGVSVQVTFAAANTSVAVKTTLTGNVKGYRVERSSVAMNVFDGAPPDGITTTKGVIYLQSSAAGTATVYVY